MSKDTRKASKKPYTAPRLVTYGDIAQLTQNRPTAKQKADGGGKLKTKTI
jgi:hypothetical protein